jgi:hypothetical protein
MRSKSKRQADGSSSRIPKAASSQVCYVEGIGRNPGEEKQHSHLYVEVSDPCNDAYPATVTCFVNLSTSFGSDVLTKTTVDGLARYTGTFDLDFPPITVTVTASKDSVYGNGSDWFVFVEYAALTAGGFANSFLSCAPLDGLTYPIYEPIVGGSAVGNVTFS